MGYSIERADGRGVSIRTPDRGVVDASWSDLRAAARDYHDGHDDTVSALYRELLAQARGMAAAHCGERVVVDGLYASEPYAVGMAALWIADLERRWAANVEAHYAGRPEWVIGHCRVEHLDPDEMIAHARAIERATELSREIDSATGDLAREQR